MTTRAFALVSGIIYILVGILGFVPGLITPPPAGAPDLAVHHNYGYLLGLWPAVKYGATGLQPRR